jgi:hypothetical protein
VDARFSGVPLGPSRAHERRDQLAGELADFGSELSATLRGILVADECFVDRPVHLLDRAQQVR